MTSTSLVFVAVFTFLCNGLADDIKNNKSAFKRSLTQNCRDLYSLTCLKLDAISWIDKLNENYDVSIIPGVSLVRETKSVKINQGNLVAELAKEFPDDPNARLNAFLMKKISGFVSGHSLKLNLWNSAEVDTVGTARKKNKKGGSSMGTYLAAGAMMKAMLMTLALGGLAAIAGKALMTALISFLLSAIVGLKGLTSKGGGHSTYEVVAKPAHSHSHEGWDRGYEGYGRNSESYPLPLALQPEYKHS